jgi:hypothetical protein
MENMPQMPSQLIPNQGQYPPQGYLPPVSGYPQMPPNQFYQQEPSLPNSTYMPGLQRAKPPRMSRRSRGLAMILRGVLLVVGGIVLSMISYSCASSIADNGGTGYYTIFTGAIVIGAMYAIVGFIRWLRGH